MRLERDGEAGNPGRQFQVHPFDDPDGDFDGDLFGSFDCQSFEEPPPDSGGGQPSNQSGDDVVMDIRHFIRAEKSRG